ncbi:hypothetical protein OBV_43720 [Oscillibacter valericigenes Sjm18-20]|nr:hypothetical protein OBV_43720 [Oscillibacter valericigenes Sjm18-20]
MRINREIAIKLAKKPFIRSLACTAHTLERTVPGLRILKTRTGKLVAQVTVKNYTVFAL